MLRLQFFTAALLVLASCQQAPQPSGNFEPSVNNQVAPRQAMVAGAQGKPQTVASSRDADGVQSDFIVGVVRVRGVSQEQLNAFLSRYGGVVIGDDGLPDPPAGSGVTFTQEQRRPTEYVVRIDLAKVDTSNFAASAARIGLTGATEFSSQEALQTIAAVVDAVAAGYRVSADYLLYPRQTFPATLLATQEGNGADKKPIDAFSVDQQGFGTREIDGFSNVTLAWQFVGAHGISRRAVVAIVDGGFWLDAEGKARISDTDFPFGVKIPQHDFVDNDEFADGPDPIACAPDQDTCWHGTQMAGVAAGLFNNQGGAVGTGGLVADLILLKTSTKSTIRAAIRYAVAMGADVVNMSFGAPCNTDCRISDREDNPIDDAFNAGSKTVFVAAAPNEPYDVGEPKFDHPCIEKHVICIGALDFEKPIKADYSGFGDEVDLFAPTDDIAVMPMPDGNNSDPAGPYGREIGTGCSTATAFVSGVAAMVKAINPDLNSEQVEVLLRETAHTGEGLAPRYLDAYAAVRRAAEGIPAVKDRYEVGPSANDLDTTPTDLTLPEFGGVKTFYDVRNLNIHRPEDRDYFKFQAPANSTAIIDLDYPAGLGDLTVLNAQTIGNCAPPVLTGQETPRQNLRRFTYRLGGGTYEFAVAGSTLNAYDLSIVLAATAIEPDIYESPTPNDNPENARLIQSIRSVGGGGAIVSYAIDPTITINATLHNETDVDWYIVRGAKLSLADVVYMNGSPAVTLYGNDAPITLEVFARNDNNTPGTRVDIKTGLSCTAQPLVIPVTKDVYYFVKVTGSAGRYVLHNGIAGEKRLLPILVQDRAYEVLHPLDPIIKALQQPEFFVFVADPAAYPNIIASGPPLHMRLFDIGGNLISEGQVQGAGERINLAGTMPNAVYALQVSPLNVTVGQPDLNIAFEAAPPARESGNLIINGDAEILVGPSPDEIIPYWSALTGGPEILAYGLTGFPSASDPGPPDRGTYLLAGGQNNELGAIRQIVNIDPSWFEAINAGRVRFRLSAYLGGFIQENDTARVRLVFRGGGDNVTGSAELPAVTALERQSQTGLLLSQISDLLPIGTVQAFADVTFERADGFYNDGYADNVEFALTESAQ